MKIIVDTNIVFSGILNTNSKIGDLLLNSDQFFQFYSVSYLRLKLEEHKEKILDISGLRNTQIDESRNLIFSKITFISEEQIPFKIWKESLKIVRDVDIDDIAFVALSKYLNGIKLWTGDKELYKGLIAKGFQDCISTQELFELRNKIEKKDKSEKK